MKCFKVRWTEGGQVHTSVVSYDEASAERRKQELGSLAAVESVEIITVKPGEAPWLGAHP